MKEFLAEEPDQRLPHLTIKHFNRLGSAGEPVKLDYKTTTVRVLIQRFRAKRDKTGSKTTLWELRNLGFSDD